MKMYLRCRCYRLPRGDNMARPFAIGSRSEIYGTDEHLMGRRSGTPPLWTLTTQTGQLRYTQSMPIDDILLQRHGAASQASCLKVSLATIKPNKSDLLKTMKALILQIALGSQVFFNFCFKDRKWSAGFSGPQRTGNRGNIPIGFKCYTYSKIFIAWKNIAAI